MVSINHNIFLQLKKKVKHDMWLINDGGDFLSSHFFSINLPIIFCYSFAKILSYEIIYDKKNLMH